MEKKINEVARQGESRMIEVAGFPMHIVVRARAEGTEVQVISRPA